VSEKKKKERAAPKPRRPKRKRTPLRIIGALIGTALVLAAPSSKAACHVQAIQTAAGTEGAAPLVKTLENRAIKGDATAMHELGALYRDGQQTARDYVLAHKWFNLASTWLGAAKRERDLVAQCLSTPQLAHAQQLATDWMIRNLR